ncbi:hypothetical protein ABPG77_008877 [Micractinium sp. CCAP 211/92]
MGARPERHYRRPESPEEDDPRPAVGSPTAASTAAAAANGRGSGPAAPPATSQQQDDGLPSRRSQDGENSQQKADLSQRADGLVAANRRRNSSREGRRRSRSRERRSRSRSRSRSRERRPKHHHRSRAGSHSRSRSRSKSLSHSRSPLNGHRRRSRSHSLSSDEEGQQRHGSHDERGQHRRERSRDRSRHRSRERHHGDRGHRSHSGRRHDQHSHRERGEHAAGAKRHHHHHSHHRKRSRSPAERGEQQEPQPPLHQQASAPEQQQEDGEGELLRRPSSGTGASSLVKLSLRHSMPSPVTAAVAEALVPPRPAAPGPSAGPPDGASPAGPAGLLKVHTPSAAALAAAQGVDLADVAMVQPSPMAAEATVAALSALMQQPARQPSLHAQPRSTSGSLPGSATAAAAGKQLLSFGDELEDDESEGGARFGGGLAAATSKRFKHEKTLVMLNPLLSGDLHTMPSFQDDEELPVSPAAPLDKRLGQVLWGSAQAKGMRPYMEDRHTIVSSFQPRTTTGSTVQDGVYRAYAAVFDGHNGASAAEHVADRLHHVLAAEHAMRTCTGEGPPATALQEEERIAAAMVHSFEAVDREIMTRCRLEGTKGGATGLVVLRIGNQLYAAHCGDTRAVMSRNGEALRLTEDHKPNLPRERKRVEALGGRVDFARCWRVIVEPGGGRPASGLAVSRSFGDPDFKEPLHLVTATPDVIRERLLPGDEFVILASDGLWDVMSDSDACAVVRRHLQQAGAPRQITPPQLLPGAAAFGASSFAEQLRRPVPLTPALATAAAERLVQESLDRGTMDNVTAIVGLLQWD